jgi:6-phosphogluconolactonase (cycloisomerase 2 family)
MKTVQEVYSGGKGPRDFILCEHSLIAANRYSDSIVCFERKEDGTIGAETSRISVPQPVSLAVLES